MIFFNEKKIEKDSDNFWSRKLTLKVKFWSNFGTFDTSQLIQFSKFKNFLWVCWFLGKNLSNFIPPVWKLHKPYCHCGESNYGNESRLYKLKIVKIFNPWRAFVRSKRLENLIPSLIKSFKGSLVHSIHTYKLFMVSPNQKVKSFSLLQRRSKEGFDI